MTSSLIQLAGLISSSVSTLVKTCDDNQFAFPRLNDSFTPESEAFRLNAEANDAANIIVAAALQLVAVVAPPPMSILSMGAGHLKAAALRVCTERSIPEILREAGPEGLEVNEIAARTAIDEKKLARILRYLATQHVFREVTPDVFANTRLSGALDTGKSVEAIKNDPASKFDKTSGLVAMVENLTSDVHKSSSYLLENLSDPITAYSEEPIHAPLNRVFHVDVPVFEWYEQPDQSYRRNRLAGAMRGIRAMQPPSLILKSLDWARLPKGALVVDVGGGIGTSSMLIAKAYPHLNITIQDMAGVVEQGRKTWEREYPDILASGRVKFQAHDFFTSQPERNASVFFLNQILHDWSDSYCVKILQELRLAATRETKLVLVDNIMSYACHDPSVDLHDGIPGAKIPEAPFPLLPNFGGANEMGYIADMSMLVVHNSQERTLGHLKKLLENTGWRIIRAHRGHPPSNFFEPVEAIPI